jgi:hypothetical protein
MKQYEKTFDYHGVRFSVFPELDIGDIFTGRWNVYVSISDGDRVELGEGNGDYATPGQALDAGIAYAKHRIDASLLPSGSTSG